MSQKNDGKLVVIMIVVLIAFGVGAGIGISIGLNHMDPPEVTNNTTHVENVTEEMTTNLTDTTSDVNIDNQTGSEDFNENKTFKNEKESLVFTRKN